MTGFTIMRHVAAPPDEVFRVSTDFEHAPGRIESIRRVEVLTPGPITPGYRFRETRLCFGREATEVLEVTELKPGQHVVIGCDNHGCSMRTAMRFMAEEGGTRVEWEFRCRPVSFTARLLTPLMLLMQGTLRREMERDLDALKAYLEAAPAPR